MINYAQKYKYGVLDEIQCFSTFKKFLIVITKTGVYCFDTKTKRKIYFKNQTLKIFRIIIFKGKMYFQGINFYNSNYELIYTLNPSTSILITEDWLLLVDTKNYIFFDGKSFNLYLHNIDDGYCTGSKIFDSKLILSFESGKLYFVSLNLLFVLPRIKNLKFEEYFDFKQTILDLAVLKYKKEVYEEFTTKLVVSLINKQIIILNEDKSTLSTELEHEVQRIYCRANNILLLDIKNNLIFMNENLKALDLLQDVKDVDVMNRDLYIALDKKVIMQLRDYQLEIEEEKQKMYDTIE